MSVIMLRYIGDGSAVRRVSWPGSPGIDTNITRVDADRVVAAWNQERAVVEHQRGMDPRPPINADWYWAQLIANLAGTGLFVAVEG